MTDKAIAALEVGSILTKEQAIQAVDKIRAHFDLEDMEEELLQTIKTMEEAYTERLTEQWLQAVGLAMYKIGRDSLTVYLDDLIDNQPYAIKTTYDERDGSTTYRLKKGTINREKK